MRIRIYVSSSKMCPHPVNLSIVRYQLGWGLFDYAFGYQVKYRRSCELFYVETFSTAMFLGAVK